MANTTSTTTTSTSSTTTTTCPAATPPTVKGSLTATPGRFNYNSTVGLPAANAPATRPSSARTRARTRSCRPRTAAGELVGLKDTAEQSGHVLLGDRLVAARPRAVQRRRRPPTSTGSTRRRTRCPAVRRWTLNSMGDLVNFQSDLQCNFLDQLGRLLPVDDLASPARPCRRRQRSTPTAAVLLCCLTPGVVFAGSTGATPSCSAPGAGWCVARRFPGSVRNGELGFRFGEPLDVDGDGHADVAAGARFKLQQGTQQNGSAAVWSGANGAPIREWDGEWIGWALRPLGDAGTGSLGRWARGRGHRGAPGTGRRARARHPGGAFSQDRRGALEARGDREREPRVGPDARRGPGW